MTEVLGPPALPGYTPLSLVGSGGHADVYTYQQTTPRRTVAVKVMATGRGLSNSGEPIANTFSQEADYLAELSTHPSIVTVHDAGVSSDGRAYIVMDYCSRPGLGELYRREHFAVADVLKIGVRLTSAVETAHRAGIMHRDIKPANVLVTDFGWPALADFGIAATIGDSDAVGLSVPWAAPEVLAQQPTDERSDVYSLTATLYALLAGRSPFEVPGGLNEPYDLMLRVQRGNPPATGRSDVPDSLERVLARGLASQDRRYPTAAALGHALQEVEAELGLAVTPLDLSQAAAPATQSTANPPPATAQSALPTSTAAPREDSPGPLQPWEATRVRPREITPEPAPPPQAAPTTRNPRRGRVALAAVIALVVVTVGVVFGVQQLGSPAAAPTTSQPSATLEIASSAPTPTGLTAQRSAESVTFSWSNPVPQPGDQFRWQRQGETETHLTSTTSVQITSGAEDSICVSVWLVRENGTTSATPASECSNV